jgi:YfiH family protein
MSRAPPKSSMLSPIQASNLAEIPGIRHGFFTREGGVSNGIYRALNCGPGSADVPEDVVENRRRVAQHLGGHFDGVVTLYQQHSSLAHTIEGPVARDALPRADAVVTGQPGLVIGILTADCAPVLFADEEAKVVAAAHAGWRGAVGGILESAVAEMERHGAKRSRIAAALGPCINQPAYEVGEDFVAHVLAKDPNSEEFFAQAALSKPHFDLRGYVLSRLRAAGLQSVADEGRCTYENESLFFSFRRTTHRKEPDYGRQISAIVVA